MAHRLRWNKNFGDDDCLHLARSVWAPGKTVVVGRRYAGSQECGSTAGGGSPAAASAPRGRGKWGTSGPASGGCPGVGFCPGPSASCSNCDARLCSRLWSAQTSMPDYHASRSAIMNLESSQAPQYNKFVQPTALQQMSFGNNVNCTRKPCAKAARGCWHGQACNHCAPLHRSLGRRRNRRQARRRRRQVVAASCHQIGLAEPRQSLHHGMRDLTTPTCSHKARPVLPPDARDQHTLSLAMLKRALTLRPGVDCNRLVINISRPRSGSPTMPLHVCSMQQLPKKPCSLKPNVVTSDSSPCSRGEGTHKGRQMSTTRRLQWRRPLT